jgi:ketosteroid isomerase-like protein
VRTSDTNVGLVRRAFEAFNARDVDALLELVDPAIEFFPVTRMLANNGQPYRGHSGMSRYMRDVEQFWDELEAMPRTFKAAGECVAAYGRVHGRTAAGELLNSPADWIWQVREGVIVWGCVYAKQDEARRVIGDPTPDVDRLLSAS